MGRDRSGIYEIRGSEGEKQYAGVMILKKISEDNQYAAQWTTVIGQSTHGVKNGYLIFSWTNGQIHGLTEYKLTDNGKYKGRWFHRGITKISFSKLLYPQEMPSESVPIKCGFTARSQVHEGS